MSDEATIFARDRYLVMRDLIKKDTVSRFHAYVCEAVKRRPEGVVDCLVPNAPFAYGDFMTDGLMASLLPRIEEASALRLFATYTYSRIYGRGDALPRHKDRPSCELSISLCLAADAQTPWPLWIEGPTGSTSVILEPGDALLYRGTECFHWRDAFDGNHQAHLFVHYVDQNGPNAHWKFDKRAALGDPLSGEAATIVTNDLASEDASQSATRMPHRP